MVFAGIWEGLHVADIHARIQVIFHVMGFQARLGHITAHPVGGNLFNNSTAHCFGGEQFIIPVREMGARAVGVVHKPSQQGLSFLPP